MLITDVKLFKSQNMTQNPDAGRRMSSVEIVSNTVGNVFDVIPEVAYVYGRVDLAKLFIAVTTENTEIFYGGHIIVSAPPADENVKLTLMTTASAGDNSAWFDDRNAARSKLESYLGKFVPFNGYSFRMFANQNGISVWQYPNQTPPAVGEVYYVSEVTGGAVDYEQKVKITQVSTEFQTFYDGQDALLRKVSTCTISAPLNYSFTGVAVAKSTPSLSNVPTLLYKTRVLDAARFYSIGKLSAQANANDFEVIVDDPFVQIMPSSTSEVPLTDLAVASTNNVLIQASTGQISYATTALVEASAILQIGHGFMPGSFALVSGASTVFDLAGKLKLGTDEIGECDYSTGELTFYASAPTLTGGKTITVIPAGAPSSPTESMSIPVTQANLGKTWPVLLPSVPASRTLSASYRAQGNWYQLTENGAGALVGADTSFGSGSLNSSGAATLFTEEYPDVNTEIIWQWATPGIFFDRTGVTVQPAKLKGTVANKAVEPSTVTFEWTVNGTSVSVTDNGHGVLSGTGGTGVFRYSTGDWELIPALLPNDGTVIYITYDYGAVQELTFTNPSRGSGGKVALQIGTGNLTPGKFEIEMTMIVVKQWATGQTVNGITTTTGEDSPSEYTLTAFTTVDSVDLGWANPTHIFKAGTDGSFDGGLAGSINFTTGALEIYPLVTVSVPRGQFTAVDWSAQSSKITEKAVASVFNGWEYIPAWATLGLDGSATVKVRYRVSGSLTTSPETYTVDGLKIDLTSRYAEQIVPGACVFDLGGLRYIHRNGSLQTNFNIANGSATAAGALNLASGEADLTTWIPGGENAITMRLLTTTIVDRPVDSAVFRFPTAPIRPGLTSVKANLLDGTLITALVQSDGTFDDSSIRGTVDAVNGIVKLQFGEWVTDDATAQAQWWYSADLVQGGQVWKPYHVQGSSIHASAVGLTSLPLDSSIIGVDPVGLPDDGRVPWIRKGDLAVLHKPYTVSISSVTEGQSIDSGKIRVARATLKDADGTAIPLIYAKRDAINDVLLDRDGQTAVAVARRNGDTEAQVLTIAEGLAVPATAWTFNQVTGHLEAPADIPTTPPLPLSLKITVEDVRHVSQVDIAGRVRFTKKLSHSFPVGSYLSSALYIGDMQARVSNIINQATWTGVWSDSLIGDESLAKFDDLNYPIEVKNFGCEEEDWLILITRAETLSLPALGRVIGKRLGVVSPVGDLAITSDIAPVNDATGTPYFTIRNQGWGAGHALGSCLRFKTAAATYPIWPIRTVLQSDDPVSDDGGEYLIRGSTAQGA